MTGPNTFRRLGEPAPTEEDVERLRRIEQEMEEERRRVIEESEKLPELDPSIWENGV